MKNIHEKIKKFTKFRWLILLIILYIAFNIFFFSTKTPIGKFFLKDIKMEYILDMKKSGYTFSEVKDSLESLGENGRNAYIRNLFTIDIVHPILLSFLLLIGLSLFINKINFNNKILALSLLFPVLYLITDIVENIFIALLIKNFPNQSSILINFASSFTVIKWISLNFHW